MNPFVRGTERDLADAVAAWAKTLEPGVAGSEKAGEIPPDVVRELAGLGVLGMTLPEQDGGLGASTVAFAMVLEELSAAWPSASPARSSTSPA